MTDEEREELEARFNSKPLTDRQKELEATVKFTSVSPTVKVKEMKSAEYGGLKFIKVKEMKPAEKKAKTVVVGREFLDLKEIAEDAGRYGFAPSVVHCIGDKEEAEIYELLDYWYGLDKRKPKQSFADNVIEYIRKERRSGYTLPWITPIKIKWIHWWAYSTIVRRALKSTTLRTIFGNDVGKLKRYVEYCEVAKNPTQMAKAAVNVEVPEEWRYNELHDALEGIGLSVGTRNNWKTAIREAAINK